MFKSAPPTTIYLYTCSYSLSQSLAIQNLQLIYAGSHSISLTLEIKGTISRYHLSRKQHLREPSQLDVGLCATHRVH